MKTSNVLDLPVRIIEYTSELKDSIEWLFEDSPTRIAFDTETMGQQWYGLSRELALTPPASSRHKEIEKLMGELTRKKEAISVHTNILATIQLASETRGLLIILKRVDAEDICKQIQHRIDTQDVTWLVHNAKFDLAQLRHHADLSFKRARIWDTNIAEVILIGGLRASAALKHTAPRYTDRLKGEEGSAVSDWWSRPLTPVQIDYAMRDVIILHDIFAGQHAKHLEQGSLNCAAVEMKLIEPLRSMGEVGVKLDKDLISAAIPKYLAKKAELTEFFYQHFPTTISISSPEQVKRAFKEKYGSVPTKMTYDKKLNAFKEVESVDKAALIVNGWNKIPEVAAYIEIKHLDHIISDCNAFLDSEGGRFHAEFISVKGASYHGEKGGTDTGRISSSPNIQNKSALLKQFMVADEGWSIVSADYAGVEFRGIGAFAADPTIQNLLRDKVDPHTYLASRIFSGVEIEKKGVERKIGKECNFGFLFGMYERRFCHTVATKSGGEMSFTPEQARTFRQTFFSAYPRIAEYHKEVFADACLYGFVTTRAGRRRYYDIDRRPPNVRPIGRLFHPRLGAYIDSTRATDWKWRNISYNTPVQGTCAEGMKLAIVKLYDEIHKRELSDVIRPFATVHDSLDMLVRDDYIDIASRLLAKIMVSAMLVYIPEVPIAVEVSVGKCWSSGPASDSKEIWVGRDYQKEIYTLEESIA